MIGQQFGESQLVGFVIGEEMQEVEFQVVEDDVVMFVKVEVLILIFFCLVFWSMRYSNLEYMCVIMFGSRSIYVGEFCGGDMNELSGRMIVG